MPLNKGHFSFTLCYGCLYLTNKDVRLSSELNTEVEYSYSPSALLNLFSASLNVAQARKMVSIKGIYVPGNSQAYNGFYYDNIKDEASDAAMKLIVPALIRNKLTPNKTISVLGYVTKKVINNGGRIELLINVTELVAQTHNKYNEEEILALEIQKRKADAGYRDVQSFIKQKVVQGEKVRVVMLIGKSAIIDQDIKHQLEAAVNAYDISFQRISFTSERDIIETIKKFNTPEVDVLIVSRGGGENVELFNKPAIAEACVNLIPFLCTAIGHKDDVTLLQRVADKAFITPTALGQFLNDVFNETIDELQNSRAKLVEDITKTLKANFEKQIQNLNEQLKASEHQKQQLVNDVKQLNAKEKEGLEKLNAEKIDVLNQTIKSINDQQKTKEELINNYKRQVEGLQLQISQKPAKEINWGVIILAIIIGIVIGVVLAGK